MTGLRAVAVRGVVTVLAAGALVLPHSAVAAEADCSARHDTRVTSMSDDGIALTSSLGLASGRYALPETTAPTQLVVMFHGHGNDSCGWRNHLREASAKGAVAVAMDYTGQRDIPSENYGWFVREGAADSIVAAKHFLAAYPSITTVFAVGISMGGNAAGLAVASADATRADGSPLFDYFVDIEGVNNLIEEYLIARGVAPVNSGGALAQQEIEEENGGSLEAVPAAYADLTNVRHALDMRGLKGAVIVQGLDDGLVPTNQGVEMTVALNAVGVPAHQVSVVGRGGGEPGTTLTAIPGGPVFSAAGQPPYVSPFAGHGWEGSATHMVIKTGFEQLFALMDGGTVAPGVTVVPGT